MLSEYALLTKYFKVGIFCSESSCNLCFPSSRDMSVERGYLAIYLRMFFFKLFASTGLYCLFDKDDCPDDKFNKIITQCRKKEIIPAFSIPCYEYWLLLHIRKTNKPFANAQECCEVFRTEYNKHFGTNYEINTLKSRKDIFNDLKDKLDTAISNAERLNLNEKEEPYTNMHKIIKDIID